MDLQRQTDTPEDTMAIGEDEGRRLGGLNQHDLDTLF